MMHAWVAGWLLLSSFVGTLNEREAGPQPVSAQSMRLPDWRLVRLPTDIFRLCRLFEIEPSSKGLFQFTADENIRENPRFFFHAKAMVQMIDTAVAFLGPDLEPLKDDLEQLGKRHIAYGVHAKFLPVMEEAVIYALEELLLDKFRREDRISWEEVFNYIVMQMIKGMGQR